VTGNTENLAGAFGPRNVWFRRVVADHLHPLQRLLSRKGVSAQEVDDAVQETLLVAYGKADLIEPAAERQFLVAIALRVASNLRRGARRRGSAYERYSQAIEGGITADFDEHLDSHRARALAGAALEALAPEVRELVMMCELGDLQVAEAAAQLGIPVGTAASRLRRGRRAFEERLRAPAANEDPSPAGAESAVVFHWWATQQERDALDAMLEVHRIEHPQAGIVSAHGGGAGSFKPQLSTRILWNQPPDTFQASVGRDVLDWVRLNGHDDADSRLRPIDDVLSDGGLLRAFPRELVDSVGFGDHLYAVPINILRTNTLYFHRRRLAELGLAAPATLSEFLAAAEELRRHGVTPLAVGARQPWALTLLAFENLMVSVAGADYYEDFFRGRRSPGDPQLRETLETLKKVLAYANDDALALTWNEAVDRMLDGAAAMTVMGDWARGYLVDRGARCVPSGEIRGELPDPDEFGEVATFGTSEVFVFASDAFALPAAARRREAALDLLRTLSTKAAQVAFSRRKGSIPARLDVAASDLAPAARQTLLEFRSRKRVPTLTSLAPRNFVPLLDAAMAQFALNRDVDDVLRVLKGSYSLLRA
jgi:glucose/mannose transport system substrate-binding protein